MKKKLSHNFSKVLSFRKVSLVMLLLIGACSGKKNAEKIPVEIIPFDSMVVVMADIHIAEAKIFTLGNPGSSDKANLAAHYKFVYEKNKTDYPRFKKSFDYYKEHVSLLNDLYDKVIDELSKRQAEVEK